MGNLLEISVVDRCMVLIERNWDTHQRAFYSATIHLPNDSQMILDDRILPRLKKRLNGALEVRQWDGNDF